MHVRWWRLVIIAAAVTCANPQSQSQPATLSGGEPCVLEPGPVRTVTRVLDSETLTLDDGSEVRLIGALGPRAADAGAAAGAWPAEIDTINVLSGLVLGKSVKLAYGGRRTDRYGRHLAHLFLQNRGTSEWVQGALLAAGAARAYGLPGSFSCARELLAHEREARDNRRGLWASATYRLKPANRPAYLMTLRHRFERVEGAIVSVSRTKTAVYLNFGNDWTSDFTARIGREVLAANPEWARALDAWKGTRVVVRGWIERRNGPLIDVLDRGQIETLEREPGGVGGAPHGSDTMAAPAASDGREPSKQQRPDPPLESPGATDL